MIALRCPGVDGGGCRACRLGEGQQTPGHASGFTTSNHSVKVAIVYGGEIVSTVRQRYCSRHLWRSSTTRQMDLIGLIREVAPDLGDASDGFTEQMLRLDGARGPEGDAGRLELLLDAASQLGGLLSMIDPNVSTKLDERSRQFAAVRHELDRVGEQLAAAGLASGLPAIHAGVLQPIPLETTGASRRPVLPTLRSAHGATRWGPPFKTARPSGRRGGSGTADAARTSRTHKRNGVVNLAALAALRCPSGVHTSSVSSRHPPSQPSLVSVRGKPLPSSHLSVQTWRCQRADRRSPTGLSASSPKGRR
jgi:hypothetical protein